MFKEKYKMKKLLFYFSLVMFTLIVVAVGYYFLKLINHDFDFNFVVLSIFAILLSVSGFFMDNFYPYATQKGVENVKREEQISNLEESQDDLKSDLFMMLQVSKFSSVIKADSEEELKVKSNLLFEEVKSSKKSDIPTIGNVKKVTDKKFCVENGTYYLYYEYETFELSKEYSEDEYSLKNDEYLKVVSELEEVRRLGGSISG